MLVHFWQNKMPASKAIQLHSHDVHQRTLEISTYVQDVAQPEIKFPLFYWHALNGNLGHDICPYIDMDGIFARCCKGCWKGRLYLHSTGSMSKNQHVCRRRSVMFSVLKVLKRIVGTSRWNIFLSVNHSKR